MSMIGEYARVTTGELGQVLGDPQWGQELLDELSETAYPRRQEEPDDGRVLDIDKAWNGIWYLLQKAGGGPVDIVGGGVPVSDIDRGYGPARYLTADEVRAGSAHLQATTWESLASHYDPGKMSSAEIYPAIWDQGDEPLDYLRVNYESLVAFFAAAASVGDAVILWIG
jgi:hypothetical protein